MQYLEQHTLFTVLYQSGIKLNLLNYLCYEYCGQRIYSFI